ncbi:hypothetical protein LINGRAHAP2_LOCUS5204, partial [Linum grandiflorum]
LDGAVEARDQHLPHVPRRDDPYVGGRVIYNVLLVDGAGVFEEYPARDYDWNETIFRILGETSGADDYAKDDRLKLTWLKRTFKDPSRIPSSDELQWKQYARAYALACIRSFLITDRSGVAVHPVYLLLLERERLDDDQ